MSGEYGNTLKKICFEETDKRHADLGIRLHADGIKQGEFFSPAPVTVPVNAKLSAKFIDSDCILSIAIIYFPYSIILNALKTVFLSP